MLKEIIRQNEPESRREAAAPSQPTTPVSPTRKQPTNSNYMNASKNVLSNDVEIKGTIKFSNDLIIDGKIEGEVISDGSLTVGENALVRGDIKTKSVAVFGKVEGNITVREHCDLKANAEIIGDIAAGTLAIEGGATFMGSSRVGKAVERPAAEKSQPAAPQQAAKSA